MAKLGLPLILLLTLGFCLTVDGNPISALFGKSNSDDNAGAEDKAAATTTTTTTTTAKPGDAATAAGADPSSSCGGLKGFLHICDKTEPAEPAKSVKTRSVDDGNDSDDSGSDSGEDSDEKQKEEEKEVTETSLAATVEGEVAKREAEDPEVSPAVDDALSPPIEPEDDGTVEKLQAEEGSNEDDGKDEEPESSRKRRDCRDRYGDDGKDCRKKREFVPKISTDAKKEVKEGEAGGA